MTNYRTPTLTTTVNVQWECRKRRGVERDCDVIVEFTFDGVDDLEVLGAEIVGGGEPYGIDDPTFNVLIDEAVAERASEVYGSWLSARYSGEY